MKSELLDPALNTCYFCCTWKEGNLYVCETCILEKRMSNYHFLLCKKCLEIHSRNHRQPQAKIFNKENLYKHICQNGTHCEL